MCRKNKIPEVFCKTSGTKIFFRGTTLFTVKRSTQIRLNQAFRHGNGAFRSRLVRRSVRIDGQTGNRLSDKRQTANCHSISLPFTVFSAALLGSETFSPFRTAFHRTAAL